MPKATAETRQATRSRLIQAAAKEFARVGLERASVDRISLAAGFAKGTIYNYFPSKEELFLAVVEEASAQAGASTPSPDAPARERLRAILGGFCSWAGRNDALARVLIRECLMGTPGLYPRVIGAEQPLLGELESIVREGVADGQLRPDLRADLLARVIAGLADLALVEHWASHGSPSLEEIPELVLTVVLGAPTA